MTVFQQIAVCTPSVTNLRFYNVSVVNFRFINANGGIISMEVLRDVGLALDGFRTS